MTAIWKELASRLHEDGLLDSVVNSLVEEAQCETTPSLRRTAIYTVCAVLTVDGETQELPPVFTEAQFALAVRELDRAILQVTRPAEETALALHTPPGLRTSRLLVWLFGQRVFDRVLGPTMADALFEWTEAHAAGDLEAAKRVKARAVVNLIWAAVVYLTARAAALIENISRIAGR